MEFGTSTTCLAREKALDEVHTTVGQICDAYKKCTNLAGEERHYVVFSMHQLNNLRKQIPATYTRRALGPSGLEYTTNEAIHKGPFCMGVRRGITRNSRTLESSEFPMKPNFTIHPVGVFKPSRFVAQIPSCSK